MKKKSCILFVSGLVLLLFFTSCNSAPDNKAQPDKSCVPGDSLLKNRLLEVNYSHLSPTEIISYFEKEGFDFKPELINPLSNKVKYISSKEKLLNIGVYSSDVTYQILCKKSSEATVTFRAIKSLCNEVNIESAFNESIKNRVLNNINNADTLSVITNDIYVTTVNKLRGSGTHNLYVIISAGSYIETMYLIMNSVKNASQQDKTVKKIIEQKLLFDDLYSMLQLLNTDENVNAVLTDIAELKKVFSDLTVKTENVKISKSGDGKLVLSGENKIIYSKESFNALKSSIIKLRTKWTVK